MPATVLASALIACKEECVRDLAPEPVGDVHIADEPNHGRTRNGVSLRPVCSSISAFPSSTRRTARLVGTIVNGSNDAFRARPPKLALLTFASHQHWLTKLRCGRSALNPPYRPGAALQNRDRIPVQGQPDVSRR
jgi:hypothetical protein